jgi:membrane protein YdbS with pleckstrin-like domain
MPDIFNSQEKASAAVSGQKPSVFHKVDIKAPKDIHDLPGHSHNPLSAFCYYPDNVKFVNEDPQEKVILLLRKHPITNLRWLLTGFAMILSPAIFSVLPVFDFVPFRYLLIGAMIWYLVCFAYMFEKFLTWFFHVNIVTDERIIEVDFTHLLYREITDANIDHIEDVTVEMAGAIRTIFNFGNVYVQTAAEVPRIDFEAIPHPDRVSKILRELRIEEEKEKLEGRVR